jgi:hypothetical protein
MSKIIVMKQKWKRYNSYTMILKRMKFPRMIRFLFRLQFMAGKKHIYYVGKLLSSVALKHHIMNHESHQFARY